MKLAYGLRSSVVHGGTVEKQLTKLRKNLKGLNSGKLSYLEFEGIIEGNFRQSVLRILEDPRMLSTFKGGTETTRRFWDDIDVK